MAKLGPIAVCLLFAVPFGGVGAFASWAIAATLREGWSARDWVRVRAEVDQADLQASASRKSTTYRAEGTYRYRFEGREYVSDRLGISPIGGSDNIDDWHERVAGRLADARSAGLPVTVWVNPANPAEAVVDREIRWMEVVFLTPFALAFGGVGVGALIAAFFVARGKSDGEAAPAAARAVASRASPGSSPATGVGALWGFTFLWNAISFPIAILALPEIIANEEWVGLLVLLFPLVGVLLLWGAVAATWQWIKAKITGVPAPGARRGDALPARSRHTATTGLEAPTAASAFAGFGERAAPSGPRPEAAIPEGVARVAEAGGALTMEYSRSGRRTFGVVLAFAGVGLVALWAAGSGVLGNPAFGIPFDWAITGLILAAIGWRMARSRFVVTAKGAQLRVESRGLLDSEDRTLGRAEIAALVPTHSYSIRKGAGPLRDIYTLEAELRDGKRVTIGSGLDGAEVAEAAQARVARALGLDPGQLRPARPNPKISPSPTNED